MYFQGDKVVYKGNRFHELKSRIGEICTKVCNSRSTYVVDFGDESFVMSDRVLSKHRPSKEVEVKGPEIQVLRKSDSDNE